MKVEQHSRLLDLILPGPEEPKLWLSVEQRPKLVEQFSSIWIF